MKNQEQIANDLQDAERILNSSGRELYTIQAENERLRILLAEARRYVVDAGSDEDPETQTLSAGLLEQIDDVLCHR